MSGKKKAGGAKGKANSAKDAADDDWDILEAEIQANAAAAPAVEIPPPAPPIEKEEDEEEEDDDADAAGGAKKDKKKKKKKGKKEAPATTTAAPTSAAAKAILLRRQQQEAEEARVRKLEEEEAERIRVEEETRAAEEKAIEEEKERKRKAKQDKMEAQKAAGTYMTKAEKEKAKKQQARLEAMKAAGMTLPTGDAAGASAAKPSDMFKNNKKKNAATKAAATATTNTSVSADATGEKEGSQAVAPGAAAATTTSPVEIKGGKEDGDDPKKEEAAAASVAAASAEGEEEDDDVADDWDADSGDDEWETKLTLKVGERKEAASADVEDQLEVEKRKEQEKLRVLGIERAKRDEELRKKKEEEDRLQAELEAKDREAAMRKENSRRARVQREKDALAARSIECLRAPISCIMGHVDTGKTSLLDKIRHTNVQEGEAGGRHHAADWRDAVREGDAGDADAVLAEGEPFRNSYPRPVGHRHAWSRVFYELEIRGSSLCDIAILVIDLMHTLEQQTIESINLLKKNRTPFIVALNKVDRCYGWKSTPNGPIRESLEAQDENCVLEFKDRTTQAITALMEQGLNAKLYWENDDLAHTVSLVPTSAVTGEGVPDLLMMLVTLTQQRFTEQLMYVDPWVTLTQQRLTEQLMYVESLQCTVLEVKVIEGLGQTVDVVLVNGTLKEGDTIVLSTMGGPVVTTIRALLTPPPSREMRIKSEYVHHQSISGSIGVKIVAPDIGRVIAGTSVLVVAPEDDLADVMEDVQSDISALETDERGVIVHASTLGALEALLQFLRRECDPPIPVSHFNIGPIHKKDVMRANIMNDRNMPEFATILAFDTTVDAEAREMAEESNVRIFSAEIIYHLFDQFTNFMNGLRELRKQEAQDVVVFPCVLKILPQHIFNKKDPIVLGVEVVEGTLRLNTPIHIPQLQLDVGRITRIENNHKEVTSAKQSTQVSVRIENSSNPTLYYGRQFDHSHTLYSKISRPSIDALKEFFAKEMTKDDWKLVVKLKGVFGIA
eukprot:CAMPEP_0174990070 /NCGR_PEP_ID=MMETSP0004_2-20121128/21099_1 /TAXON_ID=420556 /ORGANISM="Ochromonas sp., Strain CCMP1393" /LENGTH=1009 /DNA_ID=CAMNT_0016243601 /DNA_START=13 /DNA_END=3044 /DNA_ORIENTATION=+